jgi:RND family efflux transporter MFP subunit
MTGHPQRAFSSGFLLALALALVPGSRATAETLATAPVTTSTQHGAESFDAVVQAIRQTVIAAQVSGNVVEIRVKAGDAVQAGQVLVRLDARAADQNAAASDAQVQAARASLDVAQQEYERQQQLLSKNYISQAAFERAQAQFKATQAQVSAQLAQAGVARTQSGFFVITAPYAGVIAEIPVALGDMAMPGRPLATLYDPSALRVTATVPQTALARTAAGQGARVELPGQATDRPWLLPSRVQALPTVDPATHTVEVRMDLPRGTSGVAPGMFARAWLAAQRPPEASADPGTAGSNPARLFVPSKAVVRRAEVTALYVVDDAGRPILRQVRVGERQGESVEILSGISSGERVALDPQAAARLR